jgi:DNA invertase Pin-like site-specific DNA recombinase
MTKTALAYLRTSSATNVGPDKDSGKRQREAIAAFAKQAGYQIAGEFYDAAVSGADPVSSRPGFAAMLAAIAGNGVRTIVVETANRFARDLFVQLTGHRMLRELGVELIAADSPGAFVEDTPTATLVRNVLGAVAEFEKASLVAKLKGARDRKRAATGKCEGRPTTQRVADAAAIARKLRGKGLTLREISDSLKKAGHLNDAGRAYAPESVWAMTASPDELRERAERRATRHQARRKAARA